MHQKSRVKENMKNVALSGASHGLMLGAVALTHASLFYSPLAPVPIMIKDIVLDYRHYVNGRLNKKGLMLRIIAKFGKNTLNAALLAGTAALTLIFPPGALAILAGGAIAFALLNSLADHMIDSKIPLDELSLVSSEYAPS